MERAEERIDLLRAEIPPDCSSHLLSVEAY